ncbi:MAG: diguanylate cyclase [Gammaproteobacteria bacterium]|nr:diguanylate cyclase [Gammaproteobacteria bacterium]
MVVFISLATPAILFLIHPEQLKALVFFLGTLFGITSGGLLYLILLTRQHLANSMKRFLDMCSLSKNIVCELDTSFKIRYANPVALKTFGLSKEKCEYGIDIPDLFFKNERFRARKLLAKLLTQEEPQTDTFEMRKANGTLFYAEITLAPNIDLLGKHKGFRCIIRDVTALEEARQHIERLALEDRETGLPNQLLFEDRLSQAILKASRRKETVILLLAEPLYFKLIAESQGQAVADLVLKAIAKRLKENCRKEDTLAITNHPEFAVIMTLTQTETKIQSALTVAEKMLENLKQPLQVSGREFFLGVGMGIAIFPEDAETSEDLIKKARAAKYHAKQHGKNSYEFYQPNLTQIAHQDLEAEKRLRYAFKNEEFQLFYQPIVQGETKTLWGVEVLPFWNHSEKGLLPLHVFLSDLKTRRLSLPFVEWMLKQARCDYCAWQTHNVQLPPALLFSLTPWHEDPIMTLLLKHLDLRALPFAFEVEESNSEENRFPTSVQAPLFLKDTGKGLALALLKKYPSLAGLKVSAHHLQERSGQDEKWMRAFWNFVDLFSLTLLVHEVDTPALLAPLKEKKHLLLAGDEFGKPQSAQDLERFL